MNQRIPPRMNGAQNGMRGGRPPMSMPPANPQHRRHDWHHRRHWWDNYYDYDHYYDWDYYWDYDYGYDWDWDYDYDNGYDWSRGRGQKRGDQESLYSATQDAYRKGVASGMRRAKIMAEGTDPIEPVPIVPPKGDE